MAITNPTGNAASWPATVERRDGTDPRTTFWTATFDPLLNRTAYLYDQLLGATNGLRPNLLSQGTGTSGATIVGIDAHTGANLQGNFPASSVYDIIVTLWDEKGGLANPNVWTDVQDLKAGFTVSEDASFAEVQCRKRLLRPRVTLSDADHTIDVTQADRFLLSGAPAAPRTITIDATNEPPQQGETITLLIANLTSSAQPAYTIERDDMGGTIIAEINGDTSGDAGAIFVELEYSESAWHLGPNSGAYYDDNTFTTRAGVIPGAGA